MMLALTGIRVKSCWDKHHQQQKETLQKVSTTILTRLTQMHSQQKNWPEPFSVRASFNQ
jgi:hypothetical protein